MEVVRMLKMVWRLTAFIRASSPVLSEEACLSIVLVTADWLRWRKLPAVQCLELALNVTHAEHFSLSLARAVADWLAMMLASVLDVCKMHKVKNLLQSCGAERGEQIKCLMHRPLKWPISTHPSKLFAPLRRTWNKDWGEETEDDCDEDFLWCSLLNYQPPKIYYHLRKHLELATSDHFLAEPLFPRTCVVVDGGKCGSVQPPAALASLQAHGAPSYSAELALGSWAEIKSFDSPELDLLISWSLDRRGNVQFLYGFMQVLLSVVQSTVQKLTWRSCLGFFFFFNLEFLELDWFRSVDEVYVKSRGAWAQHFN